MCDDQSPSSWRISSAKSVSSAWMPAAASASLSPISSVVSDFTFTTSSRAVRARDVGDDRVRLGRVARPVHVAARRLRPPPRTASEVLVEAREHVGLDRAARLAELLPVGQLARRRARASRGSCRSRCGGSRRSCAFASSSRAASGKRSRHRRREDLGEVHRAARAAPRRERPPPICSRHELSTRGADLGAASPRSRAHLSASIALDVSAFLTANVPPKPQHSSARASSTSSRPRTCARAAAAARRRRASRAASGRSGGRRRGAGTRRRRPRRRAGATSSSDSSKTRSRVASRREVVVAGASRG